MTMTSDIPNHAEIQEDWRIRKMLPEDLEEVLSIESSDPLASWSKGMFLEEMQQPLGSCFVALRSDGSNQPVVGFICFRNIAEESELLKISVDRQYRQIGIGKKLMRFYLDSGRRQGVRVFHLEVNDSNQTAIRLYQSFSYHPSGVRKKFYQNKFDALLMVRED